MSEPRYHLYVKAGRDGACIGDCPFSMRANMFCHLKGLEADLKFVLIDLTDKPESFLKLNPAGTCPVLVDTQTNSVITDSAEISEYLCKTVPEPAIKAPDAAAADAVAGLFPKFVAFIKNKDPALEETVKTALVGELGKINEFLKTEGARGQFMVCDALCDVDCQLLPKLRHVQIAGKHYKGFEIPEEFKELRDYISAGESHEVFRSTCPPDAEFIHGWKRHLE